MRHTNHLQWWDLALRRHKELTYDNCGISMWTSGQLKQCWLGAVQNMPWALVPHCLILLAQEKYVGSVCLHPVSHCVGQNFLLMDLPGVDPLVQSLNPDLIPQYLESRSLLLKKTMTPLQDFFPNKEILFFNFPARTNICFPSHFPSHLHSIPLSSCHFCLLLLNTTAHFT